MRRRRRRRRERACASGEAGGGGIGKELARSRRRTRDWRVATTARSGPLKGDPDPMEKPNALRAYHGVGPRKHNKVCPSASVGFYRWWGLGGGLTSIPRSTDFPTRLG